MDDANVAALRRELSAGATRQDSPADGIRARSRRRWAGAREVVDPYFGGAEGFEQVLDQCEAACRGLLAALAPQLVAVSGVPSAAARKRN